MIHPLFDLTGKCALVTGGSKGLGKAMARGFAEAGADVFISSRNADELKKAAAEIGDGLKVKVEWMVADMIDRAQVKALAAEAVKRLGKITEKWQTALHSTKGCYILSSGIMT